MAEAAPYLVTGAQGMLGQAFCAALAGDGIALGRAECDVRDRKAVLALSRHSPSVIIHCAAIVNADACETDRDACRQTQVEGTRNVLDLAMEVGATLVYPQSFLIFDGSENPVSETTPPRPLSWYGQCKLDAATMIQDAWPDHLIVQMGGFFGGGAIDKNFVGKFVPHVCGLVREGVPSIDIGDRVWQPTYTADLAKNCLALADAGKSGVYNMASHGQAEFFEVADHCVKCLGLAGRITVNRVSAAAVQTSEKAARPDRAILANERLRADGLDLQRPWRESLSDYLSIPYFRSLTEGLTVV